MVDPPSDTNFQFDLDAFFPAAMAALREDPRLDQLRFRLVPTQISEERFWRNYFYRIFLLKQASVLAQIQDQTDVGVEEFRQVQADMIGGDENKSQGGVKEDYKPVESEDWVDAMEKELLSTTPSQSAGERNELTNSDIGPENWEKELARELSDL